MKKILCVLLAMVMLLGVLAVGAGAQGPAPPEDFNSAMPVITRQPAASHDRLRTNYDAVMLRVEATISNGEPISYRWYRNGVVVDYYDVPFFTYNESEPGDYSYYVEVYNRANPEYSVKSETMDVEFYNSPVVWWYGVLRKIDLFIETVFYLPILVFSWIGYWIVELFR